MKNILIAVDTDDDVNTIVDKVNQFVDLKSAKIWLLHVAAPDPDFVGYEVGPQYIRDSVATDLRKEHRWIAENSARLNASGYQVDGLLIQGPTVETLLKEADKLKIDLLVIGRHQHDWLYKFFNTSTALDVTKQSNIATLTIPL